MDRASVRPLRSLGRRKLVFGAGAAAAALGLCRHPSIARALQPADELLLFGSSPYAFASSGYVSCFVVTDEPVRYLVYSHDHAGHATGGAPFAETAAFVSHESGTAVKTAIDET